MLAFVILILMFCLLIAALVAFNLLTKGKIERVESNNEKKSTQKLEPEKALEENKKVAGTDGEEVKTESGETKPDEAEETLPNTKTQKKKSSNKSKLDNEKIKGIFNKKEDEKNKKEIICSSCGSKFEVAGGNGRCPYCGAKVVKK